MRQLLILAPLTCFSLIFAAHGAGPRPAASKPRTPVLVELFTSEGCSSCPPADALISRLQHEQPVDGADIIVLGEHVDYWDGLGWHDRFSSHLYTERQTQYSARFHLDSIYTPQMVVDGASQFVGNDQAQATRSISESSRAMKLPLMLSAIKLDGRTFSAAVSAQGQARQGDLFAALIDPMDTTDVQRGENGGRRLQHVSVVRALSRIGSTRDLANGPVGFSIAAPDASVPDTMRLIVFAQEQNLGRVIGIAVGDASVTTGTSVFLPTAAGSR